MLKTLPPILPHLLRLACLAVLIALPFFASAFYTELTAKALIMAIFAMSLALLVGGTGLVSFGHAAWFGIAAYALALLTPKYAAVSLWWVFPAALLISGLSALVVGLFVLRTQGIYFIMVTLAFAQMAFYLFHDTALGGTSDGIYVNFKPDASFFGFSFFDLEKPLHLYGLTLALTLAVYLFLNRLSQSPFGRVLAGIRANEERMVTLGYKTFYYKLAAFGLSGMLAGVAGFLYAVVYGFVTPELLSWHQSGNVLLMVILGGIGSYGGAFLGAFTFITLQEVFSNLSKHWLLLMGSTIVLAVLFMPGGLAALGQRLWGGLGLPSSADRSPRKEEKDA